MFFDTFIAPWIGMLFPLFAACHRSSKRGYSPGSRLP